VACAKSLVRVRVRDAGVTHVCTRCRPIPAQHAECVALFPQPLPMPGFYAASLTTFISCVPADACPGVSASAVAAAFSDPVASGDFRFVFYQFVAP
jgi:hypothetical protein